MTRFASIYAVAVGLLMTGQWVFFLTAGQAPELVTAPIEIAFHLAAEVATAAALLLGGFGTLAGRPRGRVLTLFALGILSYSVINSPGYFAQRGEWPLVAMFAVLLVAAVVSALALIRPVIGSFGIK